jgi:hypothetical protein
MVDGEFVAEDISTGIVYHILELIRTSNGETFIQYEDVNGDYVIMQQS